jgi:hypothetical protein
MGQICPSETKTMSSESRSSSASSLCNALENPSSGNQSLARCREAFEQMRTDMLANGKSECAAKFKAIQAYKDALPPLIGADNIRDFIACVAQGMLLGTIEDNQGARLLYAARAAESTLRNRPADKQPSSARPIGRPSLK